MPSTTLPRILPKIHSSYRIFHKYIINHTNCLFNCSSAGHLYNCCYCLFFVLKYGDAIYVLTSPCLETFVCEVSISQIFCLSVVLSMYSSEREWPILRIWGRKDTFSGRQKKSWTRRKTDRKNSWPVVKPTGKKAITWHTFCPTPNKRWSLLKHSSSIWHRNGGQWVFFWLKMGGEQGFHLFDMGSIWLSKRKLSMIQYFYSLVRESIETYTHLRSKGHNFRSTRSITFKLSPKILDSKYKLPPFFKYIFDIFIVDHSFVYKSFSPINYLFSKILGILMC